MTHLLRGRQRLVLENLALRQQVAVLRCGVKRPQLHDRDRIFWSTMLRLLDTWREALHIVQPDTVVRSTKSLLTAAVRHRGGDLTLEVLITGIGAARGS